MQPQATALDRSRVLPHQTYPENTQVSFAAHTAQGRSQINAGTSLYFPRNEQDAVFEGSFSTLLVLSWCSLSAN